MESKVITPIANFSLINSVEGLIVLRHDFAYGLGGGVELKAGVPTTPQKLLELVKTLANDKGTGGFIPRKCLYKSEFLEAWFVKGQVRTLNFNVKGSKFNLTVPMPNMVFSVSNNALKVYTVIDDEVTPDSLVYQTPLFNVFKNFTLCLGSVKIPPKQEKVNYEEWEAVVFNSYFSHSNMDNLIAFPESSVDVDVEYIKTLRELKGQKKFPNTLLVPTHHTIASFLEGTHD